MKKVLYFILLPIVVIIGLPLSFINDDLKEKYNAFGRKFDNFFGVKSPHTKNYEKDQTKKLG